MTLHAIVQSPDGLHLNIDGEETPADTLPPGRLSAEELEQIRAVVPGALPAYVTADGGEDV